MLCVSPGRSLCSPTGWVRPSTFTCGALPTLNLAPGAFAYLEVTVTVAPGTAVGTPLASTLLVNLEAPYTDPVMVDNSASVLVRVGTDSVFEDGFE